VQSYQCVTSIDQFGSGAVGIGAPVKLPENSPEETEGATGVGAGKSKPTEKQMQVVAIGVAHGRRRVSGGRHGLGDEVAEEIEVA
jgi:hypothetical protein